MTIGIWVLGDQLSLNQSALAQRRSQAADTPVLLIESLNHAQARPYHRQKLVLVWSAMRHFAETLRQQQWPVTYETAPDFQTPLVQWIQAHNLREVWVMAPCDRPFQDLLETLELPCDLKIWPNNHFLWSEEDFRTWATGRKRLLMEDFYREGRKRFGILMTGDQPAGGQWNFDKDNRKPPKQGLQPPAPLWFEPDAITQEVLAQVRTLTADSASAYGHLEPFRWAVTRDQALEVLQDFVEHRLPNFGTYQDAMVTGQDTLWHGLLSPYLNLGLLEPREVIEAVETAHQQRNLALNHVEGFIRQVMGWREYMRGLYRFLGRDYANSNWFGHRAALPEFFWTGKTDLNCLRQTLDQVARTGYAHHIQRLMILGNFALIAGLDPQAVEQWFHAVFIDAYDWVMQTNVLGMGLFADGGRLASKPYAASANYVGRMSDYCGQCTYNAKARTGQGACPFNFFYWDFLLRHREKLASQGRMSLILGNLKRMDEAEAQEIQSLAQAWRDRHAPEAKS